MNEMRKLMEAVEERYVTKRVVGHEDRESHMMQRELLKIRDYASDLVDMLDDLPDGDFPHWWQAKLVKAGDYMSTIKHFLEGEIELANRKHEEIPVEPEAEYYVDDVIDSEFIDDLQDYDHLGENEYKRDSSLEDSYQIYLDFADDGKGNDIATGEPLKTFDEWLNS